MLRIISISIILPHITYLLEDSLRGRGRKEGRTRERKRERGRKGERE